MTRTELLPSEVLVKEAGDLLERFLRFWGADIAVKLGVRLAFKDLQRCFESSLAQLPVYAHRITQQEIACPSCKNRWRKAAHITVNW